MTYGSDSISYTYDNNGNITSIQTEDGTVTYEYDELYRLIREDNQILDQTIAYIYTFDGDLCRKKIYDYMPDTDLWMPQEIQPEETILYEYTADGLNLLTEYDGQTITYDAIGNPLQYRGMNLTWSNGRELYSASKNGVTTTYRYNKDGMRNRKYLSDGTVIYQIQGSLISGEQKIGQDEQSLVYELEYYYDSDGNILSMLYNGTEYYYLKNIQGDIIGILDGSGTSVVEYSYDSWGKVIEISGNQELGKRNPFRYRGYYYDEETGFYYVGSRYYDPEVCRFINADTVDILGVQDNLNDKKLYAYCDNNPVNRFDENGDIWQTALAGSTKLTGVWIAGSSNAWNPIGWTIIGVATIITVSYVGYKIYKFAKNKRGTGRAELKKQGREKLEKKKQNDNWKKNSGKKPRPQPRPHHPSKRGHRKY